MNNKFLRSPPIFIISAPSGAGKTSLVKKLCDEWDFIKPSISFTTRKKRLSEKDGIDYFFISEELFKKKIKNNEFLESQNVYDNYYGTSIQLIKKSQEAGYDVLLEIDYKGMLDIKSKLPNAISIYILPPNIDTLKRRLEKRGQDAIDVIEERIKFSKKELSYSKYADFVIINDIFEIALNTLKTIVLNEKLRALGIKDFLKRIAKK
tara:strand:+ start:26 stop:646 length:621 start_codon:yes stop_codon:yes gene_type:complete